MVYLSGLRTKIIALIALRFLKQVREAAQFTRRPTPDTKFHAKTLQIVVADAEARRCVLTAKVEYLQGR